jgi:hypothetical protein
MAATSGAQAGLGHEEGAAHVARRHTGQEAGFLIVGAVPGDHVGDDEVGVDDARHRHPAAGDLLHGQGVDEQGRAQAAVLLADSQPEQAEFLHPLDDLGRVLVPVLEFGRHRDDLPVGEVPDGGQDVLLELGQAVGLREASHGVLPQLAGSGPGGSGRAGCSPPRSLT